MATKSYDASEGQVHRQQILLPISILDGSFPFPPGGQ
jgi:hypothetical protein